MADGCGVVDSNGLKLTEDVLQKAHERFESAKKAMGGHRFVDELQFHHLHDALKKHNRWRDFLGGIGKNLSNGKYDETYNFTKLRDRVMHGRTLFPTYNDFKEFTGTVDVIGQYIDLLDSYLEGPQKPQTGIHTP